MSDLDELFSHRLSHAAEIGQLTPRSRRTIVRKDHEAIKITPIVRSSPGETYISVTPPAPVLNDKPEDPFKDPVGSAELESLSLEVPRIRIICHTPTSSVDVGFTGTLPREKHPFTVQRHTISGRPEDSSETPTLHKNTSIRKVNSGFEVLPAGTFPERPGKHAKQEIAPRSEEWSRDLEAGEGAQHKPKKLQKKRRPQSTPTG